MTSKRSAPAVLPGRRKPDRRYAQQIVGGVTEVLDPHLPAQAVHTDDSPQDDPGSLLRHAQNDRLELIDDLEPAVLAHIG